MRVTVLFLCKWRLRFLGCIVKRGWDHGGRAGWGGNKSKGGKDSVSAIAGRMGKVGKERGTPVDLRERSGRLR